jgi:uncharacterized protein with PIN domain
VSLFNIDKVPDKETTVLQCEICKGKMEEQPKSFMSKYLGLLIHKSQQTKIYCCTECKKEIFIRESKAL